MSQQAPDAERKKALGLLLIKLKSNLAMVPSCLLASIRWKKKSTSSRQEH